MKHIEQILEGIKNEQAEGGFVVVGGNDGDTNYSKSSCDLCHSRLAGNRYDAFLIYPGTKKTPLLLEVCTCCLNYLGSDSICDCPETKE